MSDIRFNRWLHQSGTGGVSQDSSGRVGIGSSVPRTTLDVVGVVSATSFTGNLTGNVTGNVNATGVSTFANVQISTGSSITVGDKFISSSGVGLGQTTTTGRNAGVGTATGTIIYNSSTQQLEIYNGTSWTASNASQFIDATGGTITTYYSGGVLWKTHSFTSSDTFQVISAPAINNTVEYLVVGGGGGGAANRGAGGGGAGGFVTGIGLTVSSAPGSYTITVGAGGGNANTSTPQAATNGIPSFITNPGISSITAQGGGIS